MGGAECGIARRNLALRLHLGVGLGYRDGVQCLEVISAVDEDNVSFENDVA